MSKPTLIARITDNDINCGDRLYLEKVSRYGARGVLLDKDANVGLIHMRQNNFYKLPGGGIHDNESAESAFIREIEEETGYGCRIIHELGYIEEHKYRNDFLQISYCFMANISHVKKDRSLSENEVSLGFDFIWTGLYDAIELLRKSYCNCDDYTMRFMIMRDKMILDHANKLYF